MSAPTPIPGKKQQAALHGPEAAAHLEVRNLNFFYGEKQAIFAR